MELFLDAQKLEKLSTEGLESIAGMVDSILSKRMSTTKAGQRIAANKEANQVLMPRTIELVKLCSDFRMKYVPGVGATGQLGVCSEPFSINYVTGNMELATSIMQDVKNYFV